MKYWLLFNTILLLFLNCTDSPNIEIIEKDIGVKFPKEYQLINKSEDWLGFDLTQEFVFQFNSNSFNELIQEVEKTFLFNKYNKSQLELVVISGNNINLSKKERNNIYEELGKSKNIGIWIKDNDKYLFIVPFFKNEDIIKLKYHPPNYEINKNDDSIIQTYTVESIIDINNKTLFYKFIDF